MIVDFHSHIQPRALRELESSEDRDWYGITVRRDPDGQIAYKVGDHTGRLTHPLRQTLEDRIAYMDSKGIGMQVLSMSPSLTQYRAAPSVAAAGAREVNDDLADIAATWPDRFAGFAHLPLQDTDAAVAELERAVGRGLVGACVCTHVNGRNWDDADLFPVLAAAERLGALVFFHPAQVRVRDLAPRHHLRNMVGNPWETTIAIGSLIFGGVLDRLPNLRTCFAHGGGYAPYAAGRFDHGYSVRDDAKAAQRPSSYLHRLNYDCITHSPSALRYLVDTVGVDNVVLGTDFPADMSSTDPVRQIRENTLLTPAEQDAILSGNARRLLRRATAATA
jgi:aminocarboxymuconate-semialdehyde decarboxylase